jgi:hypothetical protein
MLRLRQLQQQRLWNFWSESATQRSEAANSNELLLKTKLFHVDSQPVDTAPEENDEDDPTTCCTICFVPLEEGDRIGDLACRHVYHVDCLKSWVQRKNTCPLCATPIATPRKPEEAPINV